LQTNLSQTVMKQIFSALVALSFALSVHASNIPLRLWYDRPATAFEASLPIGNGKLGALIYGGADNDSIYLNDITLWTGQPINPNEDADAYKYLPKVRKALFNEDYRSADSLQHFMQGHNSEFYQPLAIINIIDLNKSPKTNYRRQLSIDSAIAKVSYARDGVLFSREYFASNPDKVIAIHLTSSKKGAINSEITLKSLVPFNVKASQGQLTMIGHAMGEEQNSTHFCSILNVKAIDGEVSHSDSSLILNGVSDAVVYFVNETSYNGFDKDPVSEGAPYLANVNDDVWHLVNYTYPQLRERHIADYTKYFNRVSLSFQGAKDDDQRTTDQQLKDYTNNNESNPYLEQLYFQYGRYLLISCSRTPGIPANLQGLWAPARKSPWRGNYTININLEENYWPAEVTNLSEMEMPVDGLVKALSVTGRYTAQHYYGINDGWCAGHNTDAWAMTNPVGTKKESPKWSNWNMGGAWLVQTLWDHFDYTQDKTYLAKNAYPLMKGAADFMLKWLVENPKNTNELITAPATSPEAEYITDKGYQGCTLYGGTSDLVIIRELLKNTLKAAKTLNIDADYQHTLSNALARLHPYKIGKRGNLQEWFYDWEDQDWHHRHQSHLLGLYPFSQISMSSTPELAAACSKTLEIKGDNSTGWSTGWRVSLWAHLHRADKSYQMIRKLLTYIEPANYNNPKNRPGGGTYPNLFDAHPPFQIDGNFGGTAGFVSMLMQSSDGHIELLPALPQQWPSGEIKGICARGGYTIDMAWKDGKVLKAVITGKTDSKVTINYNGLQKTIKVKAGKPITLK
jgi:alpha-L-fucosidase 2